MGMSGDTALIQAKRYVKKTLEGQGALKGQDGFSPIVTENKDNTDEIYKLDITTKDGTFTTPNLKGFIGVDGFSPIATVTKVGNTTTITLTDKNGTTSEMVMDGETNIIESITVNGVAVPISDKTVNIDLSGYVEKEDGKTLVSASDVSQIRKNKDDIATLNGTGDGSVDKKIADKLSEQTYLTKEIATADEVAAYIADPTTAKFNVIYLVKDETATGADVYYEYQRVGNEESSTFEMTGDTSTDLSDYAKITDVNTELDKKEKQIIDLKMLGWSVPAECPIQNYVDSDGVFHQIVGRVDLGDFYWDLHPTISGLFSTSTYFNLIKAPSNDNEIPNAYCSKYELHRYIDIELYDKNISVNAFGVIRIKDNSYTDATTFKNAMQGVYLYYELATEKTISVDGNEAVEKVNDSLAVIGKCKNLLKPTLQTTTSNGVTCTNNGDGTYTLNGTASGVATFTFYSTLQPGKYKAVGCPSNGNISTYTIQNKKTNQVGEILAEDLGNGAVFELSEETIVCSYIRIASGYSCDNLVFKPMLTTNLDATYDDFVPYTGDGDTLIDDVSSLNNDLGGLKFALKHYDNVEVDSTYNTAFVDKSLLPVDITRIMAVFIDGDNCISARRNSESNIIVTKTGDVTSLSFDLLFLYA